MTKISHKYTSKFYILLYLDSETLSPQDEQNGK